MTKSRNSFCCKCRPYQPKRDISTLYCICPNKNRFPSRDNCRESEKGKILRPDGSEKMRMRCTPKSDCFQEKERYANGSVKKACTLQFQCRGPVHDLDRSRNWRSDFGGSECSLGRPGTILNCITEGEEAEWVRTYFGNMGACRGKYEPSPGQGQEGTKQCPSEFKNDESGSSTANEKFNSNLREYYKRNRRVKRDLESIPSCSSFGKEKEKCPFQQLREDCGEIGKSSRSKKRSTVNMGFSNDTNGKLAIQLPAYMKELTLAINMERHRAKARVIRLSHRLNLCAKMCNHDLVQKTNECDMMDVLKQLGYKANKAQQFIRILDATSSRTVPTTGNGIGSL